METSQLIYMSAETVEFIFESPIVGTFPAEMLKTTVIVTQKGGFTADERTEIYDLFRRCEMANVPLLVRVARLEDLCNNHPLWVVAKESVVFIQQ